MDAGHLAAGTIVGCMMALAVVSAFADRRNPRLGRFVCPTCKRVVTQTRLSKKMLAVLILVPVCPAGHTIYTAVSPMGGFVVGFCRAAILNWFAVVPVLLTRLRVLGLIGAIAVAVWATLDLSRASRFSAVGGVVADLAPCMRAKAIGGLVAQAVLVLSLAVWVWSR